MLSHQRAGAYLSISRSLRRGPQRDRIGPVLGNGKSELAIANRGLQNDQGLAWGRMNLPQSDVQRLIVDHWAVAPNAGEAQLSQGSEAVAANDLVPLLIESGALAPENQHANSAGGIEMNGLPHTRKLQMSPN